MSTYVLRVIYKKYNIYKIIYHGLQNYFILILDDSYEIINHL